VARGRPGLLRDARRGNDVVPIHSGLKYHFMKHVEKVFGRQLAGLLLQNHPATIHAYVLEQS
jgi:hypothetical protein